ncbi:MAG: hypothetical protein J7559_08990, partial [Cohnella sp.]|nr:hypothetical protein [Cohnella sp.]
MRGWLKEVSLIALVLLLVFSSLPIERANAADDALVVVTGKTANELAETLVGGGITVDNAIFRGNTQAGCTFSGGLN